MSSSGTLLHVLARFRRVLLQCSGQLLLSPRGIHLCLGLGLLKLLCTVFHLGFMLLGSRCQLLLQVGHCSPLPLSRGLSAAQLGAKGFLHL